MNSLDMIYQTAASVCPLTFFIIPEDDKDLEDHLHHVKNYPYFTGPFEPLKRYQRIATALRASTIVRLTADCPFLDAPELAYLINIAAQSRADFVSNCHPKDRRSVDGCDVEIMSKRCLDWLDIYAQPPMREHVTQHIYTCEQKYIEKEKFTTVFYSPLINYNKLLKTSIDTKEDLDRLTMLTV
jgi:spore coat polysaccharide biosynthesis protein SpsF (cytidylyltransferase family)